MAKNKRISKICLLSLLTLFGVTACGSDDVIAKPSNYDDPILKTTEDIYNNSMETIYDAIRNGELAEDVLNKVLYQYAISAFGRYNNYIPKLAGGSDDVNITLKAAASDIEINPSNPTVAKKFIEAHEAYWSKDNDGNRVNDGRELARVSAKWETIEKRIAEKLYSDIGSSSFAYRNKFDESKYYMSLVKDLKNVVDYSDVKTYEPQIINPDVDKYDIFTATGFLHRDNYQSNYDILTKVEDSSKVEKYDATYVEDEIVPAIYRTLLTEQYLFEETYNTLGRSYARAINVISLTKNSNYPTSAEYLMREFVGEKVISAAPNAAKIAKSTNKVDIDDFNMISNIFKGVGLASSTDETVKAIRDSLVADKAIVKDTVEGEDYYKGTEYGEMMEDYSKIKDDPVLTDTSIESEFTGSGSYTKEVGKEIKTDDVRLKNHVTKGWFIKGGDLSVSEEIKTRLFSVSVAAALNTDDSNDRWYRDGDLWKYDSSRDFNKYVARINGSYFLKVETTEAHDETDPIASAKDILFSDGGTYYVVQILEAANTAKLSKTNENNYAHIYDDEVMESYVNEIAKVISSGDTYESLAKKYWLSKMDIVYHDTVIYDYFKENFPELFD